MIDRLSDADRRTYRACEPGQPMAEERLAYLATWDGNHMVAELIAEVRRLRAEIKEYQGGLEDGLTRAEKLEAACSRKDGWLREFYHHFLSGEGTEWMVERLAELSAEMGRR